MKFRTTGIAAVLAFAAQPQIAQAQECVEQADLVDATIYAMPLLYDAFNRKCSTELSPTGFIALQGSAFVAPYSAQQDARWSGAARVLGRFAASADGPSSEMDMFSRLPEEALRPFVDGIVRLKVGEEIKMEDCAKIERTVELLSPLPPENVGGMFALLMDFAEVKNPSVCPLEPE